MNWETLRELVTLHVLRIIQELFPPLQAEQPMLSGGEEGGDIIGCDSDKPTVPSRPSRPLVYLLRTAFSATAGAKTAAHPIRIRRRQPRPCSNVDAHRALKHFLVGGLLVTKDIYTAQGQTASGSRGLSGRRRCPSPTRRTNAKSCILRLVRRASASLFKPPRRTRKNKK